MELKIIEEKENALFGRKEMKGTLDSEITPSRPETLKILSKKFNVPEENIKIKGITGRFGSKTFHLEANVYSSEEDKTKTELKKKKDEIKVPEVAPESETTKPVEVAPSESTSEEKPAESITEQKPEEPQKIEAPKEEPKEESKPEESPEPVKEEENSK